MLNQELTPVKAGALIAAGVLGLGLLGWAGFRGRGVADGPRAAVEMTPVREQITGEAAPQASAPIAPMSDAEARKREALENLKFGATQSR